MLEWVNLALQNTDKFTTIIVLGVIVIVYIPLVWWVLKSFSKQNDKLLKGLENLSTTFKENLESVINRHEEKNTLEYKNVVTKIEKLEKDTKKALTNLALASGNTVMDIEQTVNLLLTNMWYVSSGKLAFLKSLLKDDHLDGREKEIRLKIEQELMKRSEDYIKEFKKYTVPLPVTDLSVWLDENFSEKDFTKFVDKIVDIIYAKRNDKRLDYNSIVELKVNDISDLMKKLQQDLGKKLRQDCEEFKNL